MWEVERKQMTECLQSLRDELEEVRAELTESEQQRKPTKKTSAPPSASAVACCHCHKTKSGEDFSVSQKRRPAARRKCHDCAAQENAKHS